MTIGKFLQTHRIEADKTQQNIADVFGWRSPQFVSNVERDMCLPPRNIAVKWCKAVEADPDKLFTLWSDELKGELAGHFGV